MREEKLSGRQQREREFYERFSQRQKITEVSFEPILGEEKRPWNSYWYVYEFALENFRYEGQRLLDLGCGSGVPSLRFAKIGYEVWGFDISPNNIKIAKTLAKRYRLEDRMHFSIQKAEQLDYPSEFFDIIVGIDILHHVEIKQAVKECFRVLKKNGSAIFREHIGVPIFEKIRNTRLGICLIPQNEPFERHVTKDERKLTTNCLSIINEIFPKLSTRRFTFLSRLDEFIRKPDQGNPSFLEKVDYLLFKTFPSLTRFGGSVVLILEK